MVEISCARFAVTPCDKGPVTQPFTGVSRLNHGQKFLPVKQTLLDALRSRYRRDTAVLYPSLHAVRNSHAVGRAKKFCAAQKFRPRVTAGGTRGTHEVKTRYRRGTNVLGRATAAAKTWLHAVGREILAGNRGWSTVIARLFRGCIAVLSRALACVPRVSTDKRLSPREAVEQTRCSRGYPR